MKTCTKCLVEQPVENFWIRKGEQRRSRCKECHHAGRPKPPPKMTEAERNEKRRAYSLMVRYGISVEEYEQKLFKQNGRCAICGGLPGKKRLHVDHDHRTGKVRDLLCSKCNTVLGHVENREFMSMLNEYSHKWEGKQ